jgi:hypothetical protein
MFSTDEVLTGVGWLPFAKERDPDKLNLTYTDGPTSALAASADSFDQSDPKPSLHGGLFSLGWTFDGVGTNGYGFRVPPGTWTFKMLLGNSANNPGTVSLTGDLGLTLTGLTSDSKAFGTGNIITTGCIINSPLTAGGGGRFMIKRQASTANSTLAATQAVFYVRASRSYDTSLSLRNPFLDDHAIRALAKTDPWFDAECFSYIPDVQARNREVSLRNNSPAAYKRLRAQRLANNRRALLRHGLEAPLPTDDDDIVVVNVTESPSLDISENDPVYTDLANRKSALSAVNDYPASYPTPRAAVDIRSDASKIASRLSSKEINVEEAVLLLDALFVECLGSCQPSYVQLRQRLRRMVDDVANGLPIV